MMLLKQPIRQIAYFVPDARAAALAHSAAFGSGPYFVADHIPLKRAVHRGVERPLDHTSAYGQWGDLMIEFVQQNNPDPSPFFDMYPNGETGIHHVAIIVDNLADAMATVQKAGFETALYAEMNDGFAFAMMDAVKVHGHMIELYEGVPSLTGFYDYVKKCAQTFDGTNVIREIKFS